VAVAVRTESPLFVQDELMESEGIILAIESDEEEDEETLNKLAEQFREFLDTVRPEDFSG
jgi:bifunctional DNase/RNase